METAYHLAVWGYTVWRRLPPHSFIVQLIGHILYDNIFKQLFENTINYHRLNCNKKLTILTIQLRIELEQLFGIVDYRIKEDRIMSQKEIELIDIICNDQNPAEAMIIAIKTIIDFLEQSESCQGQGPVSFREPA